MGRTRGRSVQAATIAVTRRTLRSLPGTSIPRAARPVPNWGPGERAPVWIEAGAVDAAYSGIEWNSATFQLPATRRQIIVVGATISVGVPSKT